MTHNDNYIFRNAQFSALTNVVIENEVNAISLILLLRKNVLLIKTIDKKVVITFCETIIAINSFFKVQFCFLVHLYIV